MNYAASQRASRRSRTPTAGSEYSTETADASRYYTHPGIAITVSSGDNGYGVEFPAAANTVTAVGGTSLRRDSSARGFGETAWAGAGSGCSAYVGQARVAEGHRLRPAHRGRRVGRRRPEHRRRGLRHLPRRRLARVRRHLGVRADRRLGLRHGQPGRQPQPALRDARRPVRRHERLQRLLQPRRTCAPPAPATTARRAWARRTARRPSRRRPTHRRDAGRRRRRRRRWPGRARSPGRRRRTGCGRGRRRPRGRRSAPSAAPPGSA